MPEDGRKDATPLPLWAALVTIAAITGAYCGWSDACWFRAYGFERKESLFTLYRHLGLLAAMVPCLAGLSASYLVGTRRTLCLGLALMVLGPVAGALDLGFLWKVLPVRVGYWWAFPCLVLIASENRRSWVSSSYALVALFLVQGLGQRGRAFQETLSEDSKLALFFALPLVALASVALARGAPSPPKLPAASWRNTRLVALCALGSAVHSLVTASGQLAGRPIDSELQQLIDWPGSHLLGLLFLWITRNTGERGTPSRLMWSSLIITVTTISAGGSQLLPSISNGWRVASYLLGEAASLVLVTQVILLVLRRTMVRAPLALGLYLSVIHLVARFSEAVWSEGPAPDTASVIVASMATGLASLLFFGLRGGLRRLAADVAEPR